ncbi:MAG: hypothetical protein V4709_14630 [Pseudomonadota bacterium]
MFGAVLALSACGGSNSNSAALLDLSDLGSSGGSSGNTLTADKVRLTVLGPINEATGQRFSPGQLVVRPSSRTVGFVARLEDIRNANRPLPLVGFGINLDVLMGDAAFSKARAVVVSADETCPTSGGARGANTNAKGEVIFCFIAPPTAEVPAGEDLTLAARATAFIADPANPNTSTAIRRSFSVIVENPQNAYSLSIEGPNGEPTQTLTVNAGQTLNNLVARVRAENGVLPTPRPFVRVVPTLGRVITPSAAGGTIDSLGRLTFGYQGGCPEPTAGTEEVTLSSNTTVEGQTLETEYQLFVQRVGAGLTTTLPANTVFSGEVLEDIRLRLVREDSASVAGATITVQAALNGVPFGQFANLATGEFGNPLTLTAPSGGSLLLDYETDAGLRTNQTVTITAAASDDRSCITATAANRALQVRTKGTGSLSIVGANGEPSGTIALSASEIGSLRVIARDGQNALKPGVTVSFTTTPAGVGRLSIPGAEGSSTATTGAEGDVTADFIAPNTVSAAQAVTVTASATIDERAITSTGYVVQLTPPEPAAAPVLTLTGPVEATPGAERTGYIATLARVDGTAVQGATLNFAAATGTIAVFEGGVRRPGLTSLKTDAAGRVAFSFTPSADAAADSTVVLNATVAEDQGQISADCESNADAVCAASRNVTIQSDDFQFTGPAFGTSVTVGNPNAEPLAFRWQTAAGAGVPECIDLAATFRGAGNAQFGLIVGDDPTPQTQIRRVQLNASGNLANSIRVYSDRSGFLEITARENRGCAATASGALTASTGVQFVDEICTTSADGRNCVDLAAPLRVFASPDASGAQRSASLTLDVRNAAYQPVDGAQVTFTILSPANAGDPNERVFPGGGTTDANGLASSRYLVPTFNPPLDPDDPDDPADTFDIRTVDIEGCVRGQSGGDTEAKVCSTRRIEIVAQPTTN